MTGSHFQQPARATACILAGLLSGLAFQGCGSDEQGSGVNQEVQEIDASESDANRGSTDLVDTIAEVPPFKATITGGGECPLPGGSPIADVQNRWSAGSSNGRNYLTATVCAGAARGDPSQGRFMIVRSYVPGPNKLELVDPRGAGPVRITRAPLGRRGAKLVRRANLRFRSVNGIRGVLHLRTNAVTLLD